MTNDADSGDVIATLKITGHGDHQMRGPVTIGRDPRADEGDTLEVDGDPLVSKSHLCLDLDQGDLIITDLGSSNGTYLHHAAGETAVPSDRWIPVPVGAEIEFGDQRMTIERVAAVDTSDPVAAPGEAASDVAPRVHIDDDDAATIEHAVPQAQPVAPISGSFWAAEVEAAEPAADVTPVNAAAPAVSPTPAAAPPAEPDIECPQCHRDLPPRSKFCDGCGAPIMPDVAATPTPTADDPGHTVVIPPGGFVPANPTPAPAQNQPAPPYGGQAPQYGGVPSGPAPQGPAPHGIPPQGPAPQGFPPQGAAPQGLAPGQYGQAPPPQGAPGHPPQQTGGLVFVDPAAATTSKGGAGKKILVGVGALVVLGLVGVGIVTLLGGDDDSSLAGSGLTRTVPTELDELWSSSVNGTSGFPGLGDTAVYVATNTPDDILFTSLTREDGDENWETTIDAADFGALVGEFNDVTVISACAFDEEIVCSVIGLDINDGDEIWREPLGDGFALERDGRLIADDGDGLTLLDPATGDRLERVRGEREFGDVNALLLDDEGDVSAYDEDLRPLFGPVEVDSDVVAVAFDGERLLVAIGDDIEYIDATGDVTSGPLLDGDVTRLVAVNSSTLVAELGDEVVVYDLDGDDAVERWSESGTLDQVVSPEGGTIVVVNTGTERLIVDLSSGDERFEVDGEIGTVSTVSATNAFVVVDRGEIDNFEGEATVTAYDWTTGDEIWSEDIEGDVRVDDVVIVVETDGDVVVLG